MAEVLHNPTPEELRAFTEAMPECRISEHGNVNVQTQVLSRSAGSTFVVDRESSGKTMTREDYERIAQMQDAYIADNDMVVIDGYIGNDPEMRTAARLVMEKRYANIAGMQQKLYFERSDGVDPQVQVIYTPGLRAPGYPDDRVIAVDLDHYVTRVLNSDYFGESKKGGLRMWNDIVYRKGGLALHAGLKVIPTSHGDKVFMIIGLSGTGKTTTTFTTQNGSRPIQDDFVGLMPGGQCLRHRERMLREDLRPGPELRALDPRRGREAERLPRERLPERRRQGRLLQRELHEERPRRVRDAGPACVRGRAQRRTGRLPADPQPQREHHPLGREALPGAGGGLLHARRDHRHRRGWRGRGGQVPAGAGDEPVLPAPPRPAGKPPARAPRHPPDRDLPAQHRSRRRQGRPTTARRRSRSRIRRRA